jgi:MFS family permease
MVGANVAGRVIGRTGPRVLAVVGLLVAAAGMTVSATWTGTAGMVTGMAFGAAGTGALFVVASATALGQVAPHEAGLASGIVSTFHEFGASLGAAVVSSIAAASIAGAGADAGADGFTRGFAAGAVVAVVTAAVALVLTRRPRSA